MADFRLLRFQGGADGSEGRVANQQAEGTESNGEQSAGHRVGVGGTDSIVADQGSGPPIGVISDDHPILADLGVTVLL
jgi:hypothetical protein